MNFTDFELNARHSSFREPPIKKKFISLTNKKIDEELEEKKKIQPVSSIRHSQVNLHIF